MTPMDLRSVKKFILFAAILSPTLACAEPERFYQEKFCAGQKEVVLADRTRVDCLTDTHAIEYEFATRWKNAIGQALWYAHQANKRAGIMLILEKPADEKYWTKLNSLIKKNNLAIDTWEIEAFKR